MDVLTWSATDEIARDRRQAYLDAAAYQRLVRSARPGPRPDGFGAGRSRACLREFLLRLLTHHQPEVERRRSWARQGRDHAGGQLRDPQGASRS